jgi:hypothetical protein
MLKKSATLLVHSIERFNKIAMGSIKKCINIGCGADVRPLWINCDINPHNSSVIKFDLTNSDDLEWLKTQKADIITCNHVIGYLSVGQVDIFLKACFACLNKGGVLILEFPDLKKIFTMLSNLNYESIDIDREYIEVIRAIYAYDYNDAFSTKFDLKTYVTGWTAEYCVHRLNIAGFTKVLEGEPETHDRRTYRDTQVKAFK